MEFSVGLSQKRICAHFNEGNLAQFGPSAKINSSHHPTSTGSVWFVVRYLIKADRLCLFKSNN